MKILSVITRANPKMGGPIQGIRNWAFESDRIGLNMDVVTFEELEDVQNWGFDKNLTIIPLGKHQTRFYYNKNLYPFLIENIAKYDNVIIHGLWLYHSFCVMKAIKWLNKNRPELILPKVFCMPHGMLDPWFQKEKKRLLKSIRNSIYWHTVEKNVVNNVSGLLFTCEEELMLARTTFSGYNPNQEINIGYGISIPPENIASFGHVFEEIIPTIKGQRFILFLSRIDIKKGVDLLVESYIQLSSENPDFPHLVIAGPKDSKYAKEMISLASKNPKIHFPGMLTGEAKWGSLYGCDAFVLHSHQENFGIAVAEALACGKPVLISNKINIYREIEEGSAGIINEDTLEGINLTLNHWLNLSDEKKFEMGNAAYSVYKKHFTSESATLNLFRALNSK
jgi:glycosyltransferase involved in cell wall biosynthesis